VSHLPTVPGKQHGGYATVYDDRDRARRDWFGRSTFVMV